MPFTRRYGVGRRARSFCEAVAPTAASILGANLLAEWDARVGVSGVTWTDSVGGRVLTGVNTPVLATDGANFSGLPVWKFVTASAQYMDEGAGQPTLIAAGATDFYCSIVLRDTDLGLGIAQNLLDMCDSGITAEVMNFVVDATGVFLTGRINPFAAFTATADTAVHLFEIFYTAGGGDIVLSIDGVDTPAGAGPGLTTAGALARVFVGCNLAPGALLASANVARVRICAAVPSASQRTQLQALDQSAWGVP